MKMWKFLQIAVLILLAGGSQSAYSAFWQWSRTASNNATADPTINWSEGQSPSSVNDSARAMMARAADYRDDISGLLRSTGTSSAYVITTNQGGANTGSGGSAYVDGFMFSFSPHIANAITPTMSVDGGTPKALVLNSATATLPAATIIPGSQYRVYWRAGGDVWVLEASYGNPYNLPLGGLLPYTGATVPNSNFIFPAGQCISTTTYAAYWVLMGSPASGACPGGQFAVIDLRGRNPLPLDNLNGTAANRITATGCGVPLTSVGAACATTEMFTIGLANLPAYTPSGTNGTITSSGQFLQGGASDNFTSTAGSGQFANLTKANVTAPAPSWAGDAQGGISQPFSRLIPSIGVTYLLRVL